MLARAKALGDRLIFGLSTDGVNSLKHKSSLLDFDNQRIVLEAVRYVDLVIPEGSWGQKVADVRRYGVNLIVMGDDWEEKFDFLKSECEVVYLPRTENISSTLIREEFLELEVPPR
ncbi:Glycerol-3-phosphate cytidylyltransferase [compost metagenome]